MNKEDFYVDGVLLKFAESLKDKKPEEIIKEQTIAQCRYMDKVDIYDWIASDEIERYKQKEEIQRLNNIINRMEKFFKYEYDNEVRPLNDRKISV